MRSAVSQATNAANTAGSTAAGFGSGAENISSVLTPFLTRELTSPGGISQQDQTAMLSAAEGGAGGLAGGLETSANEHAAATGNSSGLSSSFGDIAHEREKAAAGASEGIAAKNAETKLSQQQEGATGLRGLYGTDVNAQLGALGAQNSAIGQEVNAGSHGWFQNMTNMIAAIRGGAQAPGASAPAPAAIPGPGDTGIGQLSGLGNNPGAWIDGSGMDQTPDLSMFMRQ